MKIWCFVASIVLLAFCQCRPDDAVPLPTEEELIDIFLDLHLAEGALARVPRDARDSISTVVREKIARQYGLEPDELQTIVAEVQRRPEMNIAIYDSVIHRLQEMKEPATLE